MSFVTYGRTALPQVHSIGSTKTVRPANRLRAHPESSDSCGRGCEFAEHDADHGEVDEGNGAAGIALEVFSQPSTSADPGESAFDDPALGEDDEAISCDALDDFDLPGSGLCDGGVQACPLVVAIGEDALDVREAAAGAPIEDQLGAIAILHIGRMHNNVQEETERVDEDVPLAALDLLARVIARRIERGPPFCAPLALWASRIAAVGLPARPACSRTAR